MGLNIFSTRESFTFKTYKKFVYDHDLRTIRRSGLITSSWHAPEKGSQINKIGTEVYKDLPTLYRSMLPNYLLARCPICGGQVWETVDTYSLRGVGWWLNGPRGFGWFGRQLKYPGTEGRHTAGDRLPEPSYQAECKHIQGMTYGVNLNGILPNDVNRWYTEIGSERPGLLRPFMKQRGSYAVLHSLPLGRYDDEEWQPRYTI